MFLTVPFWFPIPYHLFFKHWTQPLLANASPRKFTVVYSHQVQSPSQDGGSDKGIQDEMYTLAGLTIHCLCRYLAVSTSRGPLFISCLYLGMDNNVVYKFYLSIATNNCIHPPPYQWVSWLRHTCRRAPYRWVLRLTLDPSRFRRLSGVLGNLHSPQT